MRAKLRQLSLDDNKVYEREVEMEKRGEFPEASWPVFTLYRVLCLGLDLVYKNRPAAVGSLVILGCYTKYILNLTLAAAATSSDLVFCWPILPYLHTYIPIYLCCGHHYGYIFIT